MSRRDISDSLIHFTKGQSLREAFARLRKIVVDEALIGSKRRIKGAHECVCFSEAPLDSLGSGLVNPHYYSRYSPFGILVQKEWLFRLGGRPVIYQPDAEYSKLPESLQWRHVRYEPPEIDFTWEREWRIPRRSLSFNSTCAFIVVPDLCWANKLVSEYEDEQDYNILQYSQIFDREIAQMYYEPFGWNIITLHTSDKRGVSDNER